MIDDYDGSELMLVRLLRYVGTYFSKAVVRNIVKNIHPFLFNLLERNVDKHSFCL